ncbi:MAG: hypothetical protein KDC27_11015, partial [Acidobacteria bacterium]|nr:hypothetical protein [Acidobacteriota bacterium]
MSFYLKYELSRLVHSDEAKTFQAVEKATRRHVLLHLVDKAASPALVEKIQKLPAGANGQIVEVGEFAGSYYLVTDPIEEFGGLGPWLDERGAGGAPAKPRIEAEAPRIEPTPRPEPTRPVTSPTIVDEAATAKPVAPKDDEPGEFTKLFGEGATPTPRPFRAPAPPLAPAPSRPAERPRAVSEEEPGQFTKLFGEANEPKPKAPAAAPPPMSSASTAGEMTRLFGDAEVEPTPTPAAPPASAGGVERGEAFGHVSPERPAAPPPVPPAPPTSKQGSGEFTRLFGGSEASAPKAPATPPPAPLPPPTSRPAPPAPAPPQAAPPQAQRGEFTRLFGEQPSAKPAPPAQPSASEGSGEFTRMFGGGPASPPPRALGTAPDDWEIVGQDEPPPRLVPKAPPTKDGIEKSSGEFT